jgi:hypothetical protein
VLVDLGALFAAHQVLQPAVLPLAVDIDRAVAGLFRVLPDRRLGLQIRHGLSLPTP